MINDILSGILGEYFKFYDWSVFFILLETTKYLKGFRAVLVFDLGVF
jgi:hypothetical protein